MKKKNANQSPQKQVKTDALIPDFIVNQQEKELTIKAKLAQSENSDKPSSDEHSVAELCYHPGWREVKKYIIERITILQTSLDEAIASGMSFTEIGQRSVVISSTKEELKNIIDYVDSRAKYVEESNRTKSQ